MLNSSSFRLFLRAVFLTLSLLLQTPRLKRLRFVASQAVSRALAWLAGVYELRGS